MRRRFGFDTGRKQQDQELLEGLDITGWEKNTETGHWGRGKTKELVSRSLYLG